ncbi:MAG TPA: Mrp/NBP35 family ATP-binding protein [Pirellulales bacterium]
MSSSSSELTPAAVLAALADFKDPETGRGVVPQDQVGEIQITGKKLALTLALSTHSAPLWKETQAECADRLRKHFPDLNEIEVRLAVHPRPPQKLGEIGLAAKSVIAVGSGKGGVGKSTIAASLAYGLKRAGCQVGLMDADVYGPSIPHLIGVNRRPEIVEQRIQPIEMDGLKVMSMGFLVPPGEAVVWRGPMLHGAITQFLRDTAWGELDYLVIDMPPGTGDIALTLSQLLPLTGAVVVCTPQDVALLDAVKAIAMFRKVNIPVLGMVENMSYFLCPDNGKRYDIFGSGGAKRRAAELDVPFLGEVPINIQIRVNGDEGKIAGNFSPEAGAAYFEAICHTLVKNLAASHKQSPPLPKLSVLG